MKNILFVAPSSFPVNGPEAMVNAKHIYILTKMGYSVDLITRGINKRHELYPSDNCSDFFAKVNSINVVSVDTKMNFATLYRHFLTYIKTGYVYKGADWGYPAIIMAEKLCKTKKYDYIFTKDYPSEIVGLYISKKYNIRWIPTWNDPYMMEKYPSPYGYGVEYKESFLRHKLIRDISNKPYMNIFPSARLRDYMLRYMDGMKLEKCKVMPHIFLNAGKAHVKVGDTNSLNIIHTGSVGRERNPSNYMEALRLVLKEHPSWKIVTTFLGIIDRAKNSLLDDLIEKYNLQDHVKILKPIPYNECMKLVEKYDVCLIIEANCEEGIFLPTKVVDYLQNDKRILTVSPATGVLHDMYIASAVDYFGDVNDVNSIKKAIEKAYLDKMNNIERREKNLSDLSEESAIKLHGELL